MRSPLVRLAHGLLLIGLVVGSACRDFSSSKPFPCSTSGHCPDGFTCQTPARLCYASGQSPDGGISNGDAPKAADADQTADMPGVTETGRDAATEGPAPDASGTANGGACVQGAECHSTFCFDHICCDKACQGTCLSCKRADTGQPDGTCANVSTGKDPYDQCAQTQADKCGDNGSCDGQGVCQKYGTNQVCAPATCNGSNFAPAGTCNGSGACTPGAAVNCQQYQCSPASGCAKTCTIDSDCLGQSFCNNGTCAAKKTSGQTCGDKRECTSGFCVDGVCCENACTGTCMACEASLTGQANGKCAAVIAGNAHGGDCQNDGTICGHDGKCDGKGACRVGASATVCKGESCLPGTTTHNKVSTCDGKGTCVTPKEDCDRYTCTSDGVRCRSSCNNDGDCATKAYCNGGSCVADLPAGMICSRGEQCASTVCGRGNGSSGLCCSDTNKSCTCPQPSPQNLLAQRNSGLDTNVSNWKADPTDVLIWSPADADDCPFSGSMKPAGYPNQCMVVSGGTTYNFGFSYRLVPNNGPGTIACWLSFFDDVSCEGTIIGNGGELIRSTDGPVGWTSAQSSVDAPAQAHSAILRCQVAVDWEIDKLFVTPSPAGY